MTQYRLGDTEKPTVVDAVQWWKNGDHPLDAIEQIYPNSSREFQSEGKMVRRYRTPEMDGNSRCERCPQLLMVHGFLDTGQEGEKVCPGDWIVTQKDSKPVRVSHAEFEQHYTVEPGT
jgi:hypothetical protein